MCFHREIRKNIGTFWCFNWSYDLNRLGLMSLGTYKENREKIFFFCNTCTKHIIWVHTGIPHVLQK